MRTSIALLAVVAAAAACSSDNNNTGPDPRNCTAGSISAGETKTGTLNSASCTRYDWEFSGDSVHYASYDVTLDSGKAYTFIMHATSDTVIFDGTLELVGTDKNTSQNQLYTVSDDEGINEGSQLYFIAPATHTFSLRVSGYDWSDTAAYQLEEKSCRVVMPQITDSVIASSQTLLTSDCVMQSPEFSGDSSYFQLVSVLMHPNETKYYEVTSSDFVPGIQVYGPGFGTPCYYGYEGCGGWADPNYYWDDVVSGASVGTVTVAKGASGGTASLYLTADGYYGWNWWDDYYGYNDYPGAYTMAIGGQNFGTFGPYELTVQSTPPESVVSQRIVPAYFSPVLTKLVPKPKFMRTRHSKHAPAL